MGDYHYLHMDKLTRLSARLEEVFSEVWGAGGGALTPELADEIAATAGEIMLALANHRDDVLVRGALEDARRLREAARTLQPLRSQLAEAGTALTRDVMKIIHEDKHAA